MAQVISAPSAKGMQFARVPYVGDGNISHLITVGFSADFIVIVADAVLVDSTPYIIFFGSDNLCTPYDANLGNLGVENAPPLGQHFRTTTQIDVGSLDNATPSMVGYVASYGGANTLNAHNTLYAFG